MMHMKRMTLTLLTAAVLMMAASLLRASPYRAYVMASSRDDFPAPFGPEMHASSKPEKSISTGLRYEVKPVMRSLIGIIVTKP